MATIGTFSCPFCGIPLDVDAGPGPVDGAFLTVELRLSAEAYAHIEGHRPPDRRPPGEELPAAA